MNRKLLALSLSCLILTGCSVETYQSPGDNRYLGQTLPGTDAVLFAPDYFDRELHSVPVFSPDGYQMYYKAMDDRHISNASGTENEWTTKTLLKPAMLYGSDDPHLSPDGNILFFSSYRPTGIGEIFNSKERIWYMNRINNRWSAAHPLPDSINDMDMHWQFSVSGNGNIYFTSGQDLYYAEKDGENYTEPIKLPDVINTDSYESTPYVQSDDYYMIFASDQKGSAGRLDLYISFKDSNGNWTQSENMGTSINTSADEICPYISPDGNYLFFLSNRSGEFKPYWMTVPSPNGNLID